MFILVDINPIIVQNSSSVALLRFAAGKGHLFISYSVKHMKSKQFALTPFYLAAENGHLEACKLHILNAKAVIFIFVSKKLIIVHKSNKAFKIALLSTLLLKVVIYLFFFCKTFEVTTICFNPTPPCCRKWSFGSL